MKPGLEPENCESQEFLTGDAIGDTAYSERFVLKILLKLANLDSLKEDIKDKSFEADLCTLWDMTVERDVVLFLEKHNVLNLLNFALPVFNSQRLVEIVIGIVGNMCCQKEIVISLTNMNRFLASLLEFITSDDSLILIQVLRLTNSSLFLLEENDISIWLDLFEAVGYSNSLYFILKNSSNKDLLITALENLNTLCTYCNVERTRTEFFKQFVCHEALSSFTAAFIEIAVSQKSSCSKIELERTLVISLQIILNMIGFDKFLEIYDNDEENVTTVILCILKYYENKLKENEVDTDLVDVIDSAITIVNTLKFTEKCIPRNLFVSSFNIWQAIQSIIKFEGNSDGKFEDDDKKEMTDFVDQIKIPLSTFLCTYMMKCSDNDLYSVLDDIGRNFEVILGSLSDNEISKAVSERAKNYRTRLKDNVDS